MKRIPGWPRTCERCGAQIVFARTIAGETSRGGKAMPLDLEPNDAGNVAVNVLGPPDKTATCRVLRKDETIIQGSEVLAMPHWATCKPPKPLPDKVIDLTAQRKKRRGRRPARDRTAIAR